MMHFAYDLLSGPGFPRAPRRGWRHPLWCMAKRMMLLHECALVTVGTETFAHPVEVARDVARALLARPAR